MDGWMDRQMIDDRWMDGQNERQWMDGWMDKKMRRWMDGWMDG